MLTGAGRPLYDRLLQYDGGAMTFNEVEVARVPSCPVCGERPDGHRTGRSRCLTTPSWSACWRSSTASRTSCVAFSGGADSSLVLAAAVRALGPGPRGRGHGDLADVPGRGARGGRGGGRESRRRARGRGDARVRRLAVRGELARALLLLQGRAARRAGARSPRSAAARRSWTAPTPTTSATTVPACAPPRSAACCSRCWPPASARPRSGGLRARSACPPGTRRSRPAWPRASPTVSRSRPAKLAAVAEAERALRALGFRQCRVRHHGDVARARDRARASSSGPSRCGKRSRAASTPPGSPIVALDVDGFRTGSMNEA